MLKKLVALGCFCYLICSRSKPSTTKNSTLLPRPTSNTRIRTGETRSKTCGRKENGISTPAFSLACYCSRLGNMYGEVWPNSLCSWFIFLSDFCEPFVWYSVFKAWERELNHLSSEVFFQQEECTPRGPITHCGRGSASPFHKEYVFQGTKFWVERLAGLMAVSFQFSLKNGILL